MNMGGFGSPGVGEKEDVGQDEVHPKSVRQSVVKSNAPSKIITHSKFVNYQYSQLLGGTPKHLKNNYSLFSIHSIKVRFFANILFFRGD